VTCNPNEIHQALPVPQVIEGAFKIWIIITDYDCLRVFENGIDAIDHQPRNVRNVVENKISIRTN
jgi:hypothetical protein